VQKEVFGFRNTIEMLASARDGGGGSFIRIPIMTLRSPLVSP
jgi:hypothetical protein